MEGKEGISAILCLAALCSCIFLCGCGLRTREPVLESWQDEEAQDPSESAGGEEAEADGMGAEGEPTAEQQGGIGMIGEDSAAGSQSAVGSAAEEAPGTITVHVCGAVKKEGVYVLPEGSRAGDAVEAAGGFGADASTDYLNLAAFIGDACQLRVPTKEEAEALRAGASPFGGQAAAAENGGASVNGNASGSGAVDSGNSIGSGAVGDGNGIGIEAGGSGSGIGSGRDGSGSSRININTADAAELMKIPGIGESKAGRILEYRKKNGRFESVEDLMKIPGIKEASFRKMKEYVTAE